MTDRSKIFSTIENLDKRDLEIVLEIHRKSIEIGATVADQNETVIEILNENKDIHKKILSCVEDIKDAIEKVDKDIFKLTIILAGSILGIIGQILAIVLKR